MDNTIDQLTFHLLGTPEVLIAGKPLVLHHQKALALLYYLAATGRSHTRDHLAALLWSESPDSNARHSLRSSLYHIRQALEEQGAVEVLIGDGDRIHLQLNEEACDVSHFRGLLIEGSEDALAKAVMLYHGRFLQGFSVSDAPLFEEWVRFEEHELAQGYLTALQRLTSWAEEREEWDAAILYAQRVIQIDPLDEEGQQQLIRLYLRTGAIGQALRQYHQFETELRHELGLTPSSEIQVLLSSAIATRSHMSRVVRTASIHPTSVGDPKGPPLPSTPPLRTRREHQGLPFVGRGDVVQKLLGISQAAGEGQGCAVLFEGEDGIGRSRLLNELADSLPEGQTPWIILQGACSPFDDLLSYGPFLEAFQNADLGDLIDLPLQAREAEAGEQSRFLWSMLQALRILTHTAPVFLSIDDLQSANSPTLHLFCFLATHVRNLPVLLVGTVQRAEAIPALQRLVSLKRRQGDVHLLSLAPLTVEDVGTLTSSLGIASVSDTWAATTFPEWLYERSGGSPFIVTEILAQLQAEGILFTYENGLRLDVGRWRRWRATFRLPETTHDLVAWRLTNLSPEARLLLDVLAVANLPLPYKLLHEFPGLQSDQLLMMVEDLEARVLVIETGNEELALAHNLLREVLLHSMSRLRLQDIHYQLARIIEQCPGLSQHFPARHIALHAVAGEDSERARRYGLQILDELVRDNANAQTATFLHHLYDLLAQTATPNELLRLTSALGRVQSSLGQLEEAASWHRQHLEIADKLDDLLARAAAHFELGELALVANDYEMATSAARSGLALGLSTERSEHLALIARGHRLLGAALAMEGSDLSLAERHLQEAVAAHRLSDTKSELCATLFELGNVAAQRGELRQALELYQEAAHTAEVAHVYYFLALAHNNFAYHSLLLGRSEDARQALATGKKLAERHDLFGALMHLSSTQGEIHLYLGEWQAAGEAFRSSLALAEELHNLERQAGNRAGLALVERGQGNFEAALTLLEEALALITEQGYWHLRTRIQLWLAETLLLADQSASAAISRALYASQAENHVKAALETARSQNRTLLILQGERLNAYLCAASGDWSSANAGFSRTLERASQLQLPLDIARTQAMWGQALVRYAALPREGHRLLTKARQAFMLHDAKGEVWAISLGTRIGDVPE